MRFSNRLARLERAVRPSEPPTGRNMPLEVRRAALAELAGWSAVQMAAGADVLTPTTYLALIAPRLGLSTDEALR